MGDREHWQGVYSKKGPAEVSWYRPHLRTSLELLHRCQLPPQARIVDVGGGASTLVDDLLEEGYRNLAVIDLAEAALDASRARLGERAEAVDWIVGDATTELLPEQSVDLWHDRAVFHFLTETAPRQAYLAQLRRAVKPGGHVLIATFAPDGPERCSGLPVRRHDADAIHRALGEGFDKLADVSELHETPWGSPQAFVYCLCRRRE